MALPPARRATDHSGRLPIAKCPRFWLATCAEKAMNSRAMARSNAGRSETRAQTSPTSIATAPRATCPSASPAAPIPEMVAAARQQSL